MPVTTGKPSRRRCLCLRSTRKRSLPFAGWALRHPWQAAALTGGFPPALAWFTEMFGLYGPLGAAVVGAVVPFVTVWSTVGTARRDSGYDGSDVGEA